MIETIVLLALVQVPPMDEANYELQVVERFNTTQECELSRKVKLQHKPALVQGYKCAPINKD